MADKVNENTNFPIYNIEWILGIPYLNSSTEKTLLGELVMKYENLKESETSAKVSIPEGLRSTVEEAWYVIY